MFGKLLEQTVGAVCTQSANERTHLTNRKSNEGNIFAMFPLVYFEDVKNSIKNFLPKGFNLKEMGRRRDASVHPLLKMPPWELGDILFSLLPIWQGWGYFCSQLIDLSSPQCFPGTVDYRQSLWEPSSCFTTLTFIFIDGNMTNDEASHGCNNWQFPDPFHIHHLIWFSWHLCQVVRAGTVTLILHKKKSSPRLRGVPLPNLVNGELVTVSDIDFGVLPIDSFPKFVPKNHNHECYAMKTKPFPIKCPLCQMSFSVGGRNHSKQKRNLIWGIRWSQSFGWRSRSQRLPQAT